VRQLGRNKVSQDADAARAAAYERQEAAKQTERENRTAGLKSDLKL
jgi:hypothetical protein